MAMSAPDLATVRRRIGDTAAVPDLSDAVLNALYDSSTLGKSDLARTTYYAILELLGLAIVSIDVSDPTLPSSASFSQKYDHLKEMLALWGGVTGIGGASGALTVSNTNTYRTDSLQAEEPTYERGVPSLGWED
jgi:hypothetical protein